jgi:hypothetical protein
MNTQRLIHLATQIQLSYNETAKAEFRQKAMLYLRNLAKEMGLQKGTYDVRWNEGGIAVSGEATLHGEHIYVQLEQGSMQGMFMYRNCNGRKDYTGGQNHWMKWCDLLDIRRTAQIFNEVAAQPVVPI